MTGAARLIVEGDLRALARAATAVENRTREGEQILRELFSKTGRARVIGITGPPGAGKSTLVDQLTSILRAEGASVGVIAVDPTSPYSGGAVLGDRIRMGRHHQDSGVFIRSMATRGSLGGLAPATADLALLLDAAGRDWVLVETVGVGQDEVDIARLASVTVVVLVPGMGDDVQTLKAGIMEIADVFVINKADNPGAEGLEHDVRAALALAHRPDGWIPPIAKTVATEGKGIVETLAAIREFLDSGLAQTRQVESWKKRLSDLLRERVLDRFSDADLESGARAVVAGKRDPYSLVNGWLEPDFAIDHLGVAASSVDEALAFWRDTLGMNVTHRETVEKEKVQVAMLPAGDSRVELLEPSEPDSVIGKYIEKRGGGLHHVAVRVADLNGVVERLKAAGAKLLNEPRAGAGGHLYVFVHPISTGGVLLELIQQS